MEVALGLAYLGLAVILVVSGLSAMAALRASVVLLISTLALCSITWRMLQPVSQSQKLLAIGFGSSLAIGVVAVAAWVAGLLGISPPTLMWLAVLLAIAVVARPHAGFTLDATTTLLLVVFPAVVIVGIAPMWVAMPANLADSAIYPDWTFHQAIGSAAQIGYRDNPLFAGNPFGYHWIADGFGVAVERASGLDPLQGISRALYVQATLSACATALAIGWAVTERTVGAVLAGISLAFGCWIFFATSSKFLPMSTEPSPTYAASIPIALCVVALFAGKFPKARSQFALLLCLSTILAATRVTTAAVVFGSLVLTLLITKEHRRRNWTMFAGVALGNLLGLLLVGSAPSQSLEVAPNLETVRLLGLFPYTGPGDAVFGVAALLIIGASVLLLGFTASRLVPGQSLLMTIGGAAPIIAIVGSCLTLQAGSSQITFLWAAFALSSVILGPTVIMLVGSRVSGAAILIVLLAGLVFLAILMLALLLSTGLGFSGVGRWALAFGISALVLIGCFLSMSARCQEWLPFRGHANARVVGSATLAVVLTAGIWSGAASTAARVSDPSLLGIPSVWIDAHEVDAARWLDQHSGAREIVATNRQCQRSGVVSKDCFSAIFNTGALSGRVVDVEGLPYSVGENPPQEALNRAGDGVLAAQGDPAALNRLASRGVTWLWVDQRLNPGNTPIAAYDNGLISLIRVSD